MLLHALLKACGKDFDASVCKWRDLLQMQCKLSPTAINDVCIQDDEDEAVEFDHDDGIRSNEYSSNDDSDAHNEVDSDDDYIEGQTDDESIEGDSDEENIKGGSGNDIEDSNNDNVEGGNDEQDSESDTCSDNQEKHINDEPNTFISKTKGSSAHPEEGDAVVKVKEITQLKRLVQAVVMKISAQMKIHVHAVVMTIVMRMMGSFPLFQLEIKLQFRQLKFSTVTMNHIWKRVTNMLTLWIL